MSFAQRAEPVWMIQDFRGSCMCWGRYFRILLFRKAHRLSCKFSLRLWSHSGGSVFVLLFFPLRRITVLFTLGRPSKRSLKEQKSSVTVTSGFHSVKGPLLQAFLCVCPLWSRFPCVCHRMSHHRALGSPVWVKLFLITSLGFRGPPVSLCTKVPSHVACGNPITRLCGLQTQRGFTRQSHLFSLLFIYSFSKHSEPTGWPAPNLPQCFPRPSATYSFSYETISSRRAGIFIHFAHWRRTSDLE